MRTIEWRGGDVVRDAVNKMAREVAEKKDAFLRAEMERLGLTQEELIRDYVLEESAPTLVSSEKEAREYVTKWRVDLRLRRKPPFLDDGAGI